ncbi:Endonuclease/exonuclease/phosphatase [Senna tora]|uniref:Endonuclease/exonuclease/phosphatase n=1 Tax=Senna tora TaxID=362788 RepID=A0A834TGB1_9FABA|nr:Endonuclease/exonuclease/phosphatase [Senna tora]
MRSLKEIERKRKKIYASFLSKFTLATHRPSVEEPVTKCAKFFLIDVDVTAKTGEHHEEGLSNSLLSLDLSSSFCPATNMHAPRLVFGGMNQVLSHKEKLSSNEAISGGHLLRNIIDSHELIDVPPQGLWFTWTNGRCDADAVWEHLDRALCNLLWLNEFPLTSVMCLSILCSDHSSMFINMGCGKVILYHRAYFSSVLMCYLVCSLRWRMRKKFKESVLAIEDFKGNLERDPVNTSQPSWAWRSLRSAFKLITDNLWWRYYLFVRLVSFQLVQANRGRSQVQVKDLLIEDRRLIWKGSHDGVYSVKASFKSLMLEDGSITQQGYFQWNDNLMVMVMVTLSHIWKARNKLYMEGRRMNAEATVGSIRACWGELSSTFNDESRQFNPLIDS